MNSRSRQKQCKKKKSILWTDDVISSNSHKNHIRSVLAVALSLTPCLGGKGETSICLGLDVLLNKLKRKLSGNHKILIADFKEISPLHLFFQV